MYIILLDDEAAYWKAYFAKLFPTANQVWLQEMVERMMNTLMYNGKSHEMYPDEFTIRLKRLWGALKALPPDADNQLMRYE